MTLLSQVLAVEQGARKRASRALTEAHHLVLKQGPLAGISREYRPTDDDGEQLPPESTRVQVTVDEVIASLQRDLVKMLDLVATKEMADTEAAADIVIEGQDEPLLRDVPVTYLLFLERTLVDLHTFVAKLPTLDPAKKWDFDSAAGAYGTAPIETIRSQKVPKVLVKYEATDRHPAQTEVYHEDVPVGRWSIRYFSGALPKERADQLLARVVALQEAVRRAREEANSMEVDEAAFGKPIFDYLFG
jgi:hypothetical protein